MYSIMQISQSKVNPKHGMKVNLTLLMKEETYVYQLFLLMGFQNLTSNTVVLFGKKNLQIKNLQRKGRHESVVVRK